MDIKLELRNIEILNKTTQSFDHGIKKDGKWNSFATTRFIYSFFTFNYLYSIDWDTSFKHNTIKYWSDNEKILNEEEQIKAYLKFVDSNLDDQKVKSISGKINLYLDKFDVRNAKENLDGIILTNRTKKIEKLKDPFIQTFIKVKNESGSLKDFYNPIYLLVSFIYNVRCNLFHGSKNVVNIIEDIAQQQRLYIYSSILLAVNDCIIDVAKKKDINWTDIIITNE